MNDISKNFKVRFVASLRKIPADLDLHLDEFVLFDPEFLPDRLVREDSSLLAAQGLPRDAAPFLSFYAYLQAEIESRVQNFGLPESYFPIGHNGSGDVVAIDMDSRHVIYFNHDRYNERVFINSSLPQFAESLCIYQEHLTKEAMDNCLDAIATIDSRAVDLGSMWPAEVGSELADES
ncbi:SUKH-4 family immunity protein [Pseudomonas lactucae]|uniref:SUKH-4 family immunity protein n=1 Tax=Pseudomonas lactucae TaxID=2813360 RepID=A0A9X0YGF8_9PSED|nr:SUKH-4 family immunity protein [Pseudomonas lactucae]MBN2978746.1 SUKH-4 family immunity protein [Pseudomonas lactucae]MBN2986025.1 SUKH-4 family immunity protein [Pseudomonas lactucae]